MTIKEKWDLHIQFAKNYWLCDDETQAILNNADDTYPNAEGDPHDNHRTLRRNVMSYPSNGR